MQGVLPIKSDLHNNYVIIPPFPLGIWGLIPQEKVAYSPIELRWEELDSARCGEAIGSEFWDISPSSMKLIPNLIIF